MSDAASTDGIASLLRTLPDRLLRAVTVGESWLGKFEQRG
jgi:hypothetical protein